MNWANSSQIHYRLRGKSDEKELLPPKSALPYFVATIFVSAISGAIISAHHTGKCKSRSRFLKRFCR